MSGSGLCFPVVWRGIPILVRVRCRARARGRGWGRGRALWGRGWAILVLVWGRNSIPLLATGWARLSLHLRTVGLGRLDYDAISLTLSRNERCKTKVFAGTTSAVDTSGELGAELLRTSLRRGLEDMSEYELNEYDGKHVQKDHW